MKERQRQWRIAEQVSDAVIVLDADRVVQYANDAAAKLVDAEKGSDLLGRFYPDILKERRLYNEDGTTPADPSKLPSEIAFRDGITTRNRVYADINASGTHRWLSVSGFPLESGGESRPLVALLIQDISRRKKREDKLRFLIESSKILSINIDLHTRLKEKMRLLIPSLADWATINLVDENGELVRVATQHRVREKTPLVERFATIASKDADAVIYRVARSGKPELYASLTPQHVQAATSDDERKRLLDALRPCSAMIVPIQSTSRVVGILSLAYTEESGRHYAQEDVDFMREFGHHLSVTIDNARLYDEIAKRDAAKDAFLATLSHELRNPLAPIKNSLELIKLKNNDELLAPDITMIEHQFDHMEKLLRDLLDVTRFTLGKVTLSRMPIDLCTLVRTVAASRRAPIERKGIGFMLHLPPKPVRISGDEVRIEQVLTNLLSNAEKFTETGSIEVRVRELGNNAVLSVTDTGVGIPEEEIGKVFDRYFQGRTRLPHQGSGLGMGLVLVREIVRLHAGSIYVESPGAGRGSTFTITLPLEPRAVPAPITPEDADTGPVRSQQKILVIDDNKEAADSLVKLLKAVGYDATAAYSGAEGIESFAEFIPDYVIIDIGMPDINGYDVAIELRTREKDGTQLIALSGYGMEEDKRRAFEAGFDQHLTKPIGLADLRTALETAS
ncbi:response regulator [Candidatus Parcubacteria bacterium]|nr:MAG: response regulator [Candidatus Parcubacteria bacterium]